MGRTEKHTMTNSDADLIWRSLKESQYNPYRQWKVGNPVSDDRVTLKVLQIKTAEDFSICAAPTLGLMVTGTDYLETQQELHRAILNHLDKPGNTMVTVTCIPPFNLIGDTLIAQKDILEASLDDDTPPEMSEAAINEDELPKVTEPTAHQDDPLAAIALPAGPDAREQTDDLAQQFGLDI